METDALDLACWSARDVLELVRGVRLAHPRDPLGMLSDALLDLVNKG